MPDVYLSGTCTGKLCLFPNHSNSLVGQLQSFSQLNGNLNAIEQHAFGVGFLLVLIPPASRE
jgi:hypothetical protein